MQKPPKDGTTQAMYQGHSDSSIALSPVLIVPKAGEILIVDGDGKQWIKAMTADDLAYLAER